jgi:hypothetical protein
MSVTTILLVNALCVLVVAGVLAAAIDLWKIGAKSLAHRRATRSWDWPAFEQEVARYTRARAGHGPAAPPRR